MKLVSNKNRAYFSVLRTAALLCGLGILLTGCSEDTPSTRTALIETSKGTSASASLDRRGAVAQQMSVSSGINRLPDNGWIYELKAVQSKLCVTLKGGGNDASLQQAGCDGSNGQRFQFLANNDGTYSFRSQENAKTASYMCLAVKGGVASDLAPIVQSACGGHDPVGNQRWKVTGTDSGYSFVSAVSNKCMVVQNASRSSGAALVQYACNGGGNEKFTMVKFEASAFVPHESGLWSAVKEMGLIASSAAVLPNGRVLYWSGSSAHGFHDWQAVHTHTGLYDPGTGAQVESVVETGYEMFCPAEVMLSDGRVLVIGGGGTAAWRDRVASYDFRTNTWKREAPLVIPRWYNSATVLSDGSVFTLGGDGDGNPIHTNMEKLGEVWSPLLSTKWRLLTGIQEPYQDSGGNYYLTRAQYYRRIFLAPNGKVLEIAPSPTMRWHQPSGLGGTTVASIRQGDTNAQGSITAQFSASQVLLAGGNIAFGNEDPELDVSHYPSRTKSYIVDLNNGTAAPTGSMRYPRYQANGVTLPDGQVIAIGGSPVSQLFSTVGAIMAPELFNPKTGKWRTMAPMTKPRIYHSTALLLPDARVWVAGGGQCRQCSVNQPSAEIYSPPYLFRSARPTMRVAQTSIGYDRTFSVSASVSGGAISRFTLIRLSATTHATNTDQRLVEVRHVAVAGSHYVLTSPANGRIAPPGYYMLFAISNKGVPSIATIVKIG